MSQRIVRNVPRDRVGEAVQTQVNDGALQVVASPSPQPNSNWNLIVTRP